MRANPFFQFLVSSLFLKSSSSCLRLLPRLFVTYILPSTFPSITGSRRQFLHKMWPIQLAFLLFIVLGYSSPVWLCVILFYFLHDRSSWSPSFFSITFQNFESISDPLSVVSKFQHHTELYSQCTCVFLAFKSNHGFNFTCTSCIIRHYATKAVEIFHILRLFLIYRNLCRRLLLSDSHCLRFFPHSFPVHIFF